MSKYRNRQLPEGCHRCYNPHPMRRWGQVQAKADKEGGVYVYSRAFKAQSIQSLHMEAYLCDAIEEEHLSLFYQPKIDIKRA